MTISRTVVLVAGSDPDLVDRLAEQLREHWAVRTAYGAETAVETADDEVDVAVIDDGLLEVEDRLLPALYGVGGCRVVLLAEAPNQVPVRDVDRELARPAPTDEVLAAVQEVRLRAHYHDLVEYYYELAIERATLLSEDGEGLAETRAGELDRLLNRLDGEIDEVIETLSEWDAFSRLCRELTPDGGQNLGDLEAGI